MAPRAGHALIGGGVQPQLGALIRAGDCHSIIQKCAVIRAQRLVGDAGGVLVQHSRLPRGVEHRLAGLGLIARDIGHSAHPPLKQGGHLRVHDVDLRARLLQ